MENRTNDSVKEKEILSAKEVMSWLEISRPTLYRLTRAGKVAAYKLAGKLFYKRSELIRAIEAGRIN
jgi:excisionase family DNA binding protein